MAEYKGLRKICTRSKELNDRKLIITYDPKVNTVNSYSFFKNSDKKENFSPIIPPNEIIIGTITEPKTMTQIEDMVQERLSELRANNFVVEVSYKIELIEDIYNEDELAKITIYYNRWLMIKDVKIRKRGQSLCLDLPMIDDKNVCEIIDDKFYSALTEHIFCLYHNFLANKSYSSGKFIYETLKKDSGVNPGIQIMNYKTLKATAHLFLNNLIKVSGLKILVGKNGLFVAWPSVPVEIDGKTQYDRKVFPYDKESYSAINNLILEKYKESY